MRLNNLVWCVTACSVLACGVTGAGDDLPASRGALSASSTRNSVECKASKVWSHCTTPRALRGVLSKLECAEGAQFPLVVGASFDVGVPSAPGEVFCGYEIPSLGAFMRDSNGLYSELAGVGTCCGEVRTNAVGGDDLVLTCDACSFTITTSP